MHKDDQISILGAGLAGSLLAVMLGEEGFRVSVFEKRNDPRTANLAAGRSINLALSHRGIKALKHAHVFDRLENLMIPMKGRMVHAVRGRRVFQAYGREGQAIHSVSRSELNQALISAAEANGVEIHFGSKCEAADPENAGFVIRQGEQETSYNADVLIGADGAFSTLRKAMLGLDRFDYQQRHIGHGYKELSMPPLDGDFALEPGCLHIWPRGEFMLIALPNLDRTFTCTLFLAFDGETSFRALQTKEAVQSFFEGFFPDIPALIPDFVDQFFRNPLSSLVTVRCAPWHNKNCILIGDAAHAIVPFYGQGMNAAFEDCRLFMELGADCGFDWRRLLPTFSAERVKDTDAIADLALQNFIEMRDRVADDRFLARKTADAAMHQKFGSEWIPLYSMVTFTDLPYRMALERGMRQESCLVHAQENGYLDDLVRVKRMLLETNAHK